MANIKDDNPNGFSGIAIALSTAPTQFTVPEPFASAVQSAFINAFKQDGALSHIGYRNVTGPHTISVLVRFDNSANAQVAPGGNGYLGGVTASTGTDSTGLAFGMRHRF